jgi:hypothetical protein
MDLLRRRSESLAPAFLPGRLRLPAPYRIGKCFSELAALTSRAGQRKFVQIPGPQHHSDVKSGVVAVMGSLEKAGAVNMIPITRKLGRHRGQAAMQSCSLFRLYANGTMVFDYLLHPGIVHNSNAPELMRSIGLEVYIGTLPAQSEIRDSLSPISRRPKRFLL